MAEKQLSRWRRIPAQVRAMLGEEHISTYGGAEMMWLEKFAHFWVMVGKSFWRNRCPVRASALAYTTLLALVPLLAVGIIIGTSLFPEGGKQQIEDVISTFVAKVAPQLDLVSKSESGEADGIQKVSKSIHDYIKNVGSGTLGATAIIVLVFIAISLLSTIEATVNDIWGSSRGRSWFARIVQYWALITLGPIFLLLIMGLNVGPNLDATKNVMEVSPFVGNVIYGFLPLLLLIFAFAGFYQLMPNTKVNWRAALAGGVVGGCLWHVNNVFGVAFFGQLVARNTEIYGKLAIVPVFLVGIYFSWLIVLFGAQVAYGYQNRRAYIQERQSENVNERGREFIALRLMTFIAQSFYRGERPPSSTQIAEALCVPSQLVGKVMEPLLRTKLLLCVASSVPDETAYAPGRPLDQITYQDILNSIRAGVGQELDTREESARALVRQKFNEISEAERRVAGSITLQALAELEQSRPQQDSSAT